MTTHKNSNNAWLSTFEKGEVRFVETSLESFQHDMRVLCAPVSRRPVAIKNWVFVAETLTAIGASSVGHIRYIIRVERTK